MKGELTFAKVNIDKAPKFSQKYAVSSIPSIILFKDGKEVQRKVGGLDAAGLKDFINTNL
jgi:thioredoxin-like negative regulator of GroEL